MYVLNLTHAAIVLQFPRTVNRPLFVAFEGPSVYGTMNCFTRLILLPCSIRACRPCTGCVLVAAD